MSINIAPPDQPLSGSESLWTYGGYNTYTGMIYPTDKEPGIRYICSHGKREPEEVLLEMGFADAHQARAFGIVIYRAIPPDYPGSRNRSFLPYDSHKPPDCFRSDIQ